MFYHARAVESAAGLMKLSSPQVDTINPDGTIKSLLNDEGSISDTDA